MNAFTQEDAFELFGCGSSPGAIRERGQRRWRRWATLQLYRKFGGRPTGLYEAIRKGVKEYQAAQPNIEATDWEVVP